MLKYETAKALQDAGLKWEPQLGDLFVADYNNGLGPTPVDVVKTDNFGDPGPEHIWIPRLDQLLVEIEKVFDWNIGSGEFWPDKPKYCMGLFYDGKYVKGQLYGDTPEEAAAKALIWILKEAK